jgi:hypothetical protein
MKRLVLILTFILLASACGGSTQETASETGASSSAQQAVLQAAAKTKAAKSARISFTGELTGGPASGTISGDGAFAGRQGRLSMDLSGLGGGQVTGRMDLVFDGLLFYIKFPPALSQRLPAGKTWVKFDLAKLGERQGIDFEELLQLGGSDPRQSLDLMRAASPDFAAVGDEEVRGVETTHYRGTVDLERLAERLSGKAGQSYRRIIELTGQSSVPVEVWIGEDGLTRRLRYEQKLGTGTAMELTEEFYDFGVEVDVSPPPATEVVDLTQLIGKS